MLLVGSMLVMFNDVISRDWEIIFETMFCLCVSQGS